MEPTAEAPRSTPVQRPEPSAQPQPQQKVNEPAAKVGVEAAQESSKVVTGETARNEALHKAAREAKVIDEPTPAAQPAMPEGSGDVDKIYTDAGATPPPKEANNRTVTIDGKQYDNTFDTGHKNADGTPNRVTTEEAKKLLDPKTRTEGGLDVGRRIAKDEALTQAFAGKDNRAAAEKHWNAMSSDEQVKIAGEGARGKSLTDAVYAQNDSGRVKVVEDVAKSAKLDIPNQRGFGLAGGNPTRDANVDTKAGAIGNELQRQAAAGANGRATHEQRQENTKELVKEALVTAVLAPLGGPMVHGLAKGARWAAEKLAPASTTKAAEIIGAGAALGGAAIAKARSLLGFAESQAAHVAENQAAHVAEKVARTAEHGHRAHSADDMRKKSHEAN